MARFRIRKTPWTKWPLETPALSTGPGTAYPMTLTLSQAMKYYYRVRDFVLSFTVGSGVFAGSYSYGLTPGLGLAALTTEHELILNGLVGPGPEPSRWTITGEEVDGDAVMTAEAQFMTITLGQDGEDYFPSLSVVIITPDAGEVSTTSNTFSVSPLDFDGISVALYSGGASPDISAVAITPVEHWEYRDRDGLNPIYDSTDGTPLLPVFNNEYAFDS